MTDHRTLPRYTRNQEAVLAVLGEPNPLDGGDLWNPLEIAAYLSQQHPGESWGYGRVYSTLKTLEKSGLARRLANTGNYAADWKSAF